MNEQLELYGGLPPFARERETSRDAAISMLPHTHTLRRKVYELIKGRGERGITCDEVEVLLDLRHQTASARIRELYLQKLIARTGRRRITRSGRGADIYIALV